MFIELTNFVSGKEFLINLEYIDEISTHESGNGSMLWSTKQGIKGYHVKQDVDSIKHLLIYVRY